MSSIILFLKSALIDLAIAAPVGPIGILCIKSTLSYGFTSGLAVGLGAALADATFGLIAALGLTAVTAFLTGNIFFIKILGGIFLIYLGIKEMHSAAPKDAIVAKPQNFFISVLTTFLLTLSNPLTILSFLAIFASIGSNLCCTTFDSLIMVAGVFIGSMLWWLILCSIVKYLHHYLPTNIIKFISIASAIALIAFGAIAIISGIL